MKFNNIEELMSHQKSEINESMKEVDKRVKSIHKNINITEVNDMENKKIFLIQRNRGSYDDFHSAVVLAKDETEALEMCKSYCKVTSGEDLNECIDFITIEEVALNKSKVLITNNYMI